MTNNIKRLRKIEKLIGQVFKVVDPNVKHKRGDLTPIQYALWSIPYDTSQTRVIDLVKLLMTLGADPKISPETKLDNNEYQSVTHSYVLYLIHKRNPEIEQLFDLSEEHVARLKVEAQNYIF